MAKREFLMLAHKYNPEKHNVSGCFISEKLDGTRCFWDGGLSRGVPTEKVPWANIYNPKTGERKSKIKPYATGLWSRYGNPIVAPDWWLNQLPCMPLDGELWAGRGNFQLCRSICSKDSPGPEWEKVEFAIVSSPSFDTMFSAGNINNTNMKVFVDPAIMHRWLDSRPRSLLHDFYSLPKNTAFEQELEILNDMVPSEGSIYLLKQKKLPFKDAHKAVEYELSRIIDTGGEGVVIRRPDSFWAPIRSHGILKYKPFYDAEGILVGFTSGRQTDKGSKHLGRIGALVLNYKGQRLELAGLTDIEREFSSQEAKDWAVQNPGVDMPNWVESKRFKKGQAITFIYRELSNDGIPKEARFFRGRPEE